MICGFWEVPRQPNPGIVPRQHSESGLMQVALVVGHAHATVKHPTLAGHKLLLTQPLLADGRRPDGPPMLAVDRFSAGPGDRVMLTSDGAAIREMFGVENSPIRWAVLGIVDELKEETR